VAAMSIDDVSCSEFLEFGGFSADHNDGSEADEAGELRGKAAAIASSAYDEDRGGGECCWICVFAPGLRESKTSGVEEADDT